MTDRSMGTSPLVYARVGGFLYLIIIIAGIFAEFAVRSQLKVPGDTAATAANIMTSEGLFRISVACDMLMIISDVALALIFYVLLKPVSKPLPLLAAFFRLTQAAVLGVNLVILFLVVHLLKGSYMAVFSADQLNALVTLFLDAHGTGYSIGLVFFGIQCLVLGYLVFKSGYFPRILGILMLLAAAGYLIDSFAYILMPGYEYYESLFAMVVFTPAFIGELSLCLWLLVKGVNVEKWESRAHEMS